MAVLVNNSLLKLSKHIYNVIPWVQTGPTINKSCDRQTWAKERKKTYLQQSMFLDNLPQKQLHNSNLDRWQC